MRLAASADAELFRRTVRDLLAAECPPAAVRLGPSRRRWRTLAALGATGLTVPEEHGGLGLGAAELVPVLEEAGYACLPESLGDCAAAAGLLAGAAPGAARHWLPKVAAGEARLALSLPPDPWPAGAQDADLVLGVTGPHTPGPHDASPHAPGLHAVRPGRGGARTVPVDAVDPTLGLAEVVWPERGTLLAADAGPAAVRAFRLGALGAAAQALGTARRILDLSVAHARVREQFGRPVGAFQAVRHRLADVLTAVEFARPAVLRAAYAFDRDLPSAARDVSLAKVLACDAADLAARAGLQTHGATGYTEEHDLHLWLRRAWALSASWGDAAHHRAAVAADLLGPDPAPPCPER